MANKYLIGILTLVLLTASVYILYPENVRIDVEKTYSTFKVWEDNSWVLAGQEYSLMFDGTTKMRASSRTVESFVEEEIIKIVRTANFKNNVTVIDTYTFDGNEKDIKLFPISHEINVLNGEGYLLVYEVTKLEYFGETVWDLESPQKFGHNMEIDWEEGNYYSRIWGYADRDEGKLTVKYRPDSADFTKRVRLFDPSDKFSKSYNSIEKNLIIKDSLNKVLIDMKLTSSQKTWATPGDDVKIAEFYLMDWDLKDTSFITKVNSYNLNKNNELVVKDYWYKYGIDYEVEECFEDEKDINCEMNTKTNWTLFDSLEDLPFKDIKIGLFTNTFKGEHIEWVPIIKRLEIIEWAEYEIIGLSTYHDDVTDYSVEEVESIFVQGDYLYTSSPVDNHISIMNISDKSEIIPLAYYPDDAGDYSVDYCMSFALSPDGNYLFTSSVNDDYVSIMNVTNKSAIVPLATYNNANDDDYSVNAVYSIVLSPDGNYLFTSSSQYDYVSIMNVTNKSAIVPLATYHDDATDYSVDGVREIAISPDGNYLFTSSYSDDRVSIMNVTDKTQILPLASYRGYEGDYSIDYIMTIAISSDGNYLYTSSSFDGYVSVMDVTDKTQILPLATYHDDVTDYSVEEVESIFVQGDYLYTSSKEDDYVSIMKFQEVAPEDTCTCPGAGENWEINMSHNCNLTTACNLTTGNITWIGTSGYFNCSAELKLTNRDAPPSSTIFYHSSGCELIRLVLLIFFIPTTIFKRKRSFKLTW